MDTQRLMDRLRVQSLMQRLRRQHGDAVAWDIVREAFEIELRVSQKKPREKVCVFSEPAK